MRISTASLALLATISFPWRLEVARAARVSGTVPVAVLVDPTGTVSIAVPIGHPILERAAEAAALRWVFAPADKPFVHEISFVFTLSADQETEVLFQLPDRVEIRTSALTIHDDSIGCHFPLKTHANLAIGLRLDHDEFTRLPLR
jgi:TonB family protein